MKEELITFETAKLAKEKGFDWDCESYYKPNTKELPSNLNGKRSWNHVVPAKEYYSAPTQSLLQKWLRGEHKIDIYVLGYGFGYYAQLNNVPPANQSDVKYIDRRWNMPPEDENSGDLRTYEEALEKGLQEALKLI
tara:strand:- start:98 stop:505 length:408 start_codon:yes stop_codon:yes gene_type:complete